MNKVEFLAQLREALQRLPQHEVDQSIAYYAEMIDDQIEDGMLEEQAVASLGNVSDIALQIINESPVVPKVIAKANTGSRTLNIVLLIVFSPIWVPLAIAFITVVLSIYFSIWIVILSLWIVVLSLVVGGLAVMVAAIPVLALSHPITALFLVGSGLACVGIGLFCFFGVLAVSKGLFELTKLFARKIRSLFVSEGSTK